MVSLFYKVKFNNNEQDQIFIGIDVSKPYFDTSLMSVIEHRKQPIETLRVENNVQGLKEFHNGLKKVGYH